MPAGDNNSTTNTNIYAAPSSPNQPGGQTNRQLKNLSLSPLSPANFQQAVSLLNQIANSDLKRQDSPYETVLADTNGAPIDQLIPQFTQGKVEKTYKQAQENPQAFNQNLLPADIVYFLYSLIVTFTDFYQEQLLKPENQILGKQLFDLRTGLSRAYAQQWVNNVINHDQEVELVIDLFKTKEIKDVIYGVTNAVGSALRQIATENEMATEGGSDSALSSAAKAGATAGGTASASKSSGEPPEDQGDSQTDEQHKEPKQPQKTQQTQEQAPNQDLETYQKYNGKLELFTNSLTQLTISSLLAAYTTTEDGATLVGQQHISPELRGLLSSHITPHIRKLILSLSNEEIDSLINPNAKTPAVRLKLLHQAQLLIETNSPVQILFQQAINEALLSPDEVEEKLTDEQKEELKTLIKEKEWAQVGTELQQAQTTASTNAAELKPPVHISKAIGTLALNDEQKQPFEKGEIQELINNRLQPGTFRSDFAEQLANLVGGDKSRWTMNVMNLDMMLTSLALIGPSLSTNFIQQFNYSQFTSMFGRELSSDQFTQNRHHINRLLEQYAALHRAELDTKYPELAMLSAMTAEGHEYEPEQIEAILNQSLEFKNSLGSDPVANPLADPTLFPDTELNQKRNDQIKTQAKPSRRGAIGYFLGRDETGSGDQKTESGITKGFLVNPEEIKRKKLESLNAYQLEQYFKATGLEGIKPAEIPGDLSKTASIYREALKGHSINVGLVALIQMGSGEFDQQSLSGKQVGWRKFIRMPAAINNWLGAPRTKAESRNLENQAAEQLTYAQALSNAGRFLIPGEIIQPNQQSSLASAYSRLYQTSNIDTRGEFLNLQDTGERGSDGSFPSTSEALQNYQPAATSQIGSAVDKLAAMGVDKGIAALTGGAYLAVPEPIRRLINEKIAKNIRKILKVIASAGAALMAYLLMALKNLSIVASSLLGAGAGLAIFGPVGIIPGALIGGATGWLAGGGLGPEATSALGKGAQDAQSSISTTARSFGGLLKDKLGPGEAEMAQIAATQATGTGIAVSAELAAVGGASLALTGTVFFVIILTAAAFLMKVDVDPSQIAYSSFFASVTKTAEIIDNKPECNGTNSCENPNYPVKVRYTVTITPENDYVLTIEDISDIVSLVYNSNATSQPNRSQPLSRVGESLIGITIDDAQTFTYEQEYDSTYNHGLIKNTVAVDFTYVKEEESGSNTARASARVYLGDAPRSVLCWPASGAITQGPGGAFSHRMSDAYDIAPRTIDGSYDLNIYAPIEGELCAGLFGPPGSDIFHYSYGESVSLKTTINGEEYLFLFAHLIRGSAIVNNGECRTVNQGQQIGLVGNSGASSSGTHLHFELRNGSSTLTELLTGEVAPVPNGSRVRSCAL